MSSIERLAGDWSDWMLAASWQLALVACIVGLLVAVLRDVSARWSYALWMLVLVKAYLPPTITSPWSIGRWVIDPLRTRLPDSVAGPSGPLSEGTFAAASPSAAMGDEALTLTWPVLLLVIWLAGGIALAAAILWRYGRVVWAVRHAPTIDEGPVRVAVEEISMRLGLGRVPEIHAIGETGSPFLLGVLTPRIAIPESLLSQLSGDEIRDVLTHELVHWQRRDPWVGWLQFVSQTLFWFHPLVWWANNQLRHQRECVCDEISLREGQRDPQQYGETIVRVLTAARGRSPVAGGMIGVFEKGSRLQNRVERIMNYKPSKQRFLWLSRAAIVGLALVLLPMAPSISQVATGQKKKPPKPYTPYPQIVETVPARGATNVDPGLDSIKVTFDRDMAGGMSWTGGGPQMPPIDKSRKAMWTDERTCVLPVRLAKGKIYRVGINSKSYQNFRAADGTPTPPDVIAFATQGAPRSLQMQIRTPKITKITPANGASDVDPSTKALRVTFDVPMGGGMSWTGGGEHFPDIPRGQGAKWSSDGKTCILPVKLKPNWDYQLGLNSLSHNNFQSKFGIPLKPVVYEFRTAGK